MNDRIEGCVLGIAVFVLSWSCWGDALILIQLDKSAAGLVVVGVLGMAVGVLMFLVNYYWRDS